MTFTYAIAEKVVIAWLKDAFTSATPCTDTPANLADVVPIMKVNRIGSALSGLSTDGARMDLEVFHSTELAALTLASQIRAALISDAPGFSADGYVIAGVSCGGPVRTPYDNTNVTRVELHPAVTIHNQ